MRYVNDTTNGCLTSICHSFDQMRIEKRRKAKIKSKAASKMSKCDLLIAP